MFRIWLIFLNLATVICQLRSHAHSNQEVEAFKRFFLDSLNLRSQPNVSRINTSTEEMQRMLHVYHRGKVPLKLSRYKSKAERTEEELKRRFVFALPQMSPSDLHSASLLLSVRPNSSGILHLLRDDCLVSTFNLSAQQSKSLDVSRTVEQWLQKPDTSREVTVACDGCQSLPSEAVLNVVSHSRKKRQIKKRIPKCKNKSDCCPKRMRINFKDIGWNWIYRPETFDFYYCKGKCDGTSLLSQNALIRHLLRRNSVKVPKLCCVPKKTRPLRILYYDDSDPPQLTPQIMKGMVVKECGCA